MQDGLLILDTTSTNSCYISPTAASFSTLQIVKVHCPAAPSVRRQMQPQWATVIVQYHFQVLEFFEAAGRQGEGKGTPTAGNHVLHFLLLAWEVQGDPATSSGWAQQVGAGVSARI